CRSARRRAGRSRAAPPRPVAAPSPAARPAPQPPTREASAESIASSTSSTSLAARLPSPTGPRLPATPRPQAGRGPLPRRPLSAGAGATIPMLAGSLALRAVGDVPTLTGVRARGFTAFVPLGVFSAIVAALDSYAKPFLFLRMVAPQMAVGVAVGLGLAARYT